MQISRLFEIVYVLLGKKTVTAKELSDREVQKNDDGSFTITLCYPEDEWVYGYILSFGHYAEVLEPPHIRAIISERLKKSLEKYL